MMKRRTAKNATWLVALAALLAAPMSAEKAAEPADLSQQSYSLGVAIARQAAAGLGAVDEEAFISGFSDSFAKRELSMSDGEMMAALEGFEERRDAETRQALAEMARANREAGETFRQSFGRDDEVVTLSSGLQYKVMEPGEGEVPAPTDTVTFHYRGTLIDGSEIDNSYNRHEPVTIQADKTLPGWREALTQMPVGSKWQVVLPPELAFGDEGAGPIEPGTTMIFEIELVSMS
jgi:FKBP-type peptidyl-prolyl cis-trans isomerase FklB